MWRTYMEANIAIQSSALRIASGKSTYGMKPFAHIMTELFFAAAVGRKPGQFIANTTA
jgi:hypothetical protein